MQVHRSNRMEALVDVLAELVVWPAGAVAAPECIVVQGKGMERWLSMQLARRLGVWANPDFPFPRRLVERALTAALGAAAAPSACFDPETLLWSIADLLPAHLERPEFTPIRAYLSGDERSIRRIQLAERIAQTFDQYVVYRPRMILGWERGDGTDWQAVLWRAVVARHGSTHVAARANALLSTLRPSPSRLDGFPERVCVFGISTLAPLYLELLAALTPQVDIHLFVLSPSREYWAWIRSQRALLRDLIRREATAPEIEAALQDAEGHPLLAALGGLGRDFQEVLEASDYQEGERDLYCDPGTATMLTTLQSDILGLRRRGAIPEIPALDVHASDASIRIHACHGPMRELEVLQDQLLGLFDADATLQPRDVVVMSPAIDAYAPFIDAVFGSAGDRPPRLPYRIADRSLRSTDEVVDAFTALLTTLPGRMSAPEVLDLLRFPAIRDRFAIAAEDLDLLRTWVSESGIRWGVDGAHRAAVQQPAGLENTWRFGLDRLLLGYAMPGAGRTLYGGVLPYDDMEGTTTELLGKLAEFCDVLFGWHGVLDMPRTLETWRDDLGRLLDSTVGSTTHTAHQHQQIRSILAELARQAHSAGFADVIDLATIRWRIDAALERDAPGRGFLTGGITFCALVPMRSIPFRVVCLLGMNDDDFPRVRRPLGFDLIAQRPLPGDRWLRNDDRYLFLEALLSARERLLITYVGQSIRDNAERAPAVVVSELLDTLGESFRVRPTLHRSADAGAPPSQDSESAGGSGRDAIQARIVVRHPLQPFSPRYFLGDAALFSYAAHYCAGARALQQAPRSSRPPFVCAPLPIDDSTHAVTLDDLVRFFENPSRAFLQRRVGLHLGKDVDRLEDREPMEPDALERWKIGNGLLARAVEGEDLDAALASVRATGSLPPGALGTCLYDDLSIEAMRLAGAVTRLAHGEPLAVVAVDAELNATRVTGMISDIWPAGLVRYQYSKLGQRQELALWIRHLVLNWLAPLGYPRDSFLVGRPTGTAGPHTVHFRPVKNAAAILADLLHLFWAGQLLPLPLFEASSRRYASALRKKGRSSLAPALVAARKAYCADEHRRGDVSDAYVQQLYGACDPLDPEFHWFDGDDGMPRFHAVAQAVFDPLLDHREETR